ncbi:MAG TPA: thioesterase family protein [Pseudomonadales bacterium]|nr:thioesterase family protein [Pseudomonadales bacterium]
MARVSVQLPEQFGFAMEMTIPIAFINRGNHLGNDSLVSCLNEARLAFMQAQFGDPYTVDGAAMINADLVVEYKAEAYHGDRLRIEVAANDFHKYGCDFVYRVSCVADGRIVALAKTGMLLFDFDKKKLKVAPPPFFAAFGVAGM